MEQRFRRQLLAFGKMGANPISLRSPFARFLEDVGRSPIERRPYPDDVRDVLFATGLPSETVDGLCAAYEREVWVRRVEQSH